MMSKQKQIRLDLRRSTTGLWIIAALILVLTTPGCSRPTAVTLNVSGAIVRSQQAGQAALWAYQPHFSITLQPSQTGSFMLDLHNVSGKQLQISLDGGGSATYTTETLSPTAVRLRFQRLTVSYQMEARTVFSTPLRFGLLGDNQGRDEVLKVIIGDINEADIDFLIHLGDMVPSGQLEEYARFSNIMSALQVPFYSVPGNHDVRGLGAEHYQALFGPMQHSFTLADYRFIMANSSDFGIDEPQLNWLAEELAKDRRALMFFHVPPRDPRNLGHAFIDEAQAQALLGLLAAQQPLAIISGHVHMFHHSVEDGRHQITSGGGGGSLYAPPDAGGFHHWAKITLHGEELSVLPQEVVVPEQPLGLVITSPDGDVEFTHEELQTMPQLSGMSAFENQFGNVGGAGHYQGIAVADLLQAIGGMPEGSTLVVESSDGYQQHFSYANVYDETSGWDELQGKMILAISLDGVEPPLWEYGYRLAFLPPQGVYTNAICAATSAPGQGWNVYGSAGARWVRSVHRLEVRP